MYSNYPFFASYCRSIFYFIYFIRVFGRFPAAVLWNERAPALSHSLTARFFLSHKGCLFCVLHMLAFLSLLREGFVLHVLTVVHFLYIYKISHTSRNRELHKHI